ncbi:MAG: hypothetical protein ACRCXL_00320 [Dermatophilaceae bacterium]
MAPAHVKVHVTTPDAATTERIAPRPTNAASMAAPCTATPRAASDLRTD